jgi:molybdopterin-guanine dinucleotide biosynthesis protein A
MIRQRKVAVCLLVGGSSERFGGSKCLVDIGLPSHKPVIQLMVERIIKI